MQVYNSYLTSLREKTFAFEVGRWHSPDTSLLQPNEEVLGERTVKPELVGLWIGISKKKAMKS